MPVQEREGQRTQALMGRLKMSGQHKQMQQQQILDLHTIDAASPIPHTKLTTLHLLLKKQQPLRVAPQLKEDALGCW
jgi:hypothetical protein